MWLICLYNNKNQIKMIQIKLTTKFLFLSIGLGLVIFSLYSFTNNVTNNTLPPRTIEVVGSAEMSLKPDKIKLQVQLRLNGKNRKEQEKKLFKILKKHGIDEKQVEYTGFNYFTGWYYHWYYYYYEYWYYNNNYYQSYNIPINSEIDPKKLLSELKRPLVNNLWIRNDGFENITEQRKKVKISAIKAAKDKASYLLEAVGEKLGTIVTIEEVEPKPTTSYGNPYWGYYRYNQPNLSSSSSNAIVNSGQSNSNTVQGAPTDKLKYEVKVLFTIKN